MTFATDVAVEAAARYRYALARGLFAAEHDEDEWSGLSDEEKREWFAQADEQAAVVGQ